MKRPWYICRGALFSHLCPQAMLYTMWGSYVCSKNSWLACKHGARRQAYPGKAFGQCSRIRLNIAATWEKDFVPPVSWCSRSPESPGISWYSPGALLVVCWCSCWSPHVLLVGLWQSHVVSWLSFLGSPCGRSGRRGGPGGRIDGRRGRVLYPTYHFFHMRLCFWAREDMSPV